MSGQQHAPTVLYPREKAGSHFTGGWVGPRFGLDGRKISYINIYIYIYTHTHIYIYTHTHIYIYIQNHTQALHVVSKGCKYFMIYIYTYIHTHNYRVRSGKKPYREKSTAAVQNSYLRYEGFNLINLLRTLCWSFIKLLIGVCLDT